MGGIWVFWMLSVINCVVIAKDGRRVLGVVACLQSRSRPLQLHDARQIMGASHAVSIQAQARRIPLSFRQSPGESDVAYYHPVAIALATRRVLPGRAVVGCLRACAAAQSAGPVGAVAQLRHAPADPDRAALHRPALGAAKFEQLRGRNSGGRVSAHYLIGDDGQRYQLVSDDQRAWHGGAGRWGTITDINSASIGIELDNDGSEPFAPAQIDSLLILLDDLCTRLRIPRTQIVGHEDVAPTRKNDPGPLFPWKRLADAGFGRWPAADAPAAPASFDPWQALALLGYSVEDPAATLRAFHHHYRGNDARTLDAEDLRILYALTQPMLTRPHIPPTITEPDVP